MSNIRSPNNSPRAELLKTNDYKLDDRKKSPLNKADIPANKLDVEKPQGDTSQLYAGIKDYKKRHKNSVESYHRHLESHFELDPEYSTESVEQSPTYFRDKFVRFITNKHLMEGPTYQGDPKVREEHPEKAQTDMNAFFGPQYTELYKLALEEEMNSTEYMDALFHVSTETFEGEEWVDRPVLFIGGPSACGKSTAAKAALINAVSLPYIQKNEGTHTANKVITVDGGLCREVSMIEQLAVKAANYKGFSGIKDLHSNSSVLAQAKKRMYNYAMQPDQKWGIVIPETFAGLGIVNIKMISDANKLPNAKPVFANVKGADPENFQRVVAQMGMRRALKSIFTDIHNAGQMTKRINQLLNQTSRTEEENREIGTLMAEIVRLQAEIKTKLLDLAVKADCESKAYGPNGFHAGVYGSNLAEIYFKKKCPNGLSLTITNDLVLVQDGEKQDILSQRLVEAWEAAKQAGETLKTFKENNNHLAPTLIETEAQLNLVNIKKDLNFIFQQWQNQPAYEKYLPLLEQILDALTSLNLQNKDTVRTLLPLVYAALALMNEVDQNTTVGQVVNFIRGNLTINSVLFELALGLEDILHEFNVPVNRQHARGGKNVLQRMASLPSSIVNGVRNISGLGAKLKSLLLQPFLDPVRNGDEDWIVVDTNNQSFEALLNEFEDVSPEPQRQRKQRLIEEIEVIEDHSDDENDSLISTDSHSTSSTESEIDKEEAEEDEAAKSILDGLINTADGSLSALVGMYECILSLGTVAGNKAAFLFPPMLVLNIYKGIQEWKNFGSLVESIKINHLENILNQDASLIQDSDETLYDVLDDFILNLQINNANNPNSRLNRVPQRLSEILRSPSSEAERLNQVATVLKNISLKDQDKFGALEQDRMELLDRVRNKHAVVSQRETIERIQDNHEAIEIWRNRVIDADNDLFVASNLRTDDAYSAIKNPFSVQSKGATLLTVKEYEDKIKEGLSSNLFSDDITDCLPDAMADENLSNVFKLPIGAFHEDVDKLDNMQSEVFRNNMDQRGLAKKYQYPDKKHLVSFNKYLRKKTDSIYEEYFKIKLDKTPHDFLATIEGDDAIENRRAKTERMLKARIFNALVEYIRQQQHASINQDIELFATRGYTTVYDEIINSVKNTDVGDFVLDRNKNVVEGAALEGTINRIYNNLSIPETMSEGKKALVKNIICREITNKICAHQEELSEPLISKRITRKENVELMKQGVKATLSTVGSLLLGALSVSALLAFAGLAGSVGLAVAVAAPVILSGFFAVSAVINGAFYLKAKADLMIARKAKLDAIEDRNAGITFQPVRTDSDVDAPKSLIRSDSSVEMEEVSLLSDENRSTQRMNNNKIAENPVPAKDKIKDLKNDVQKYKKAALTNLGLAVTFGGAAAIHSTLFHKISAGIGFLVAATTFVVGVKSLWNKMNQLPAVKENKTADQLKVNNKFSLFSPFNASTDSLENFTPNSSPVSK